MQEIDFKRFKGTIEYDSEQNQICLADGTGKKLYFQDLEQIITTHEGFKIEIKIE